jgi:hypothetical protein
MKLNKEHIAILRNVRATLEGAEFGAYICHMVLEETGFKAREELSRWYNILLFWRIHSVRGKWVEMYGDLTSAIHWGINGSSTVGNWFEHITRHADLNLDDGARHNRYLYKQIRLAWLDRMIETGEIK